MLDRYKEYILYDRVYPHTKASREVKMVTVKEQATETRSSDQVIPNQDHPEKQQRIAHGVIRGMLVQFYREWTTFRSGASGGTSMLAANALLDRHSHQIHDAVCDVEAIIGDDIAVEIRCLSADMIETTNILIMLGCEEECYRRGDALAKRCLALQRMVDAAR
jgi:hypothetical protein